MFEKAERLCAFAVAGTGGRLGSCFVGRRMRDCCCRHGISLASSHVGGVVLAAEVGELLLLCTLAELGFPHGLLHGDINNGKAAEGETAACGAVYAISGA